MVSEVLNLPKANVEEVARGEVWLVDFTGSVGAEQTGVRPAIVCSNNAGNKFSPIAIVAPISSSMSKKPLPTHVFLDAKKCGLQRDSIVLCEQIGKVDKGRLMCCIGSLNDEIMRQVDISIKISLAID